MAGSPDIWTAVNGLNQQGYEGALGALPAHQTQPGGGYGSLEAAHAHLVRPLTPPPRPTLPSLAIPYPGSTKVNTPGVSLSLQDSYSAHSLLAADASRGLPPMSTFHRNTAAPRTSESSAGEQKEKKKKHRFQGHCWPLCRAGASKLCVFSSVGEPEERVGGVTDGRHPGQSSGLGKCCTSVPPAAPPTGRLQCRYRHCASTHASTHASRRLYMV